MGKQVRVRIITFNKKKTEVERKKGEETIKKRAIFTRRQFTYLFIVNYGHTQSVFKMFLSEIKSHDITKFSEQKLYKMI